MTNNPFLSPQLDLEDSYSREEYTDLHEPLSDFIEEDEDIDIGMCFCGAYGEAGKVHVRMIDGHMEECGEYL